MKKNYLMLGSALLLAASMTAQQLPNNGFEGTWSTCTPWTNGNGKTTIGENPADWCISHVMGVTSGFFAGTGKKAMGSKDTGYNSTSAVKLVNNETGALGINREVPGYLTTGTTWSTANGATTSTHDGGTWGGYSFTKRPDAISLMYKREYANASATTEPCSFIVYLWKGTTTQTDVPVTITTAGDPKTCTMTNRDRNILDMSCITGNTQITKSSDFELIGKLIETKSGAVNDWTKLELPIEYLTASDPSMINVIFSANEYFNAAAPVVGNSLSVDDVKLVYYSRLASLSVNGTEIAGFDPNVFEYNVDILPVSEDAYATTLLGGGQTATVSVSIDKANVQALVTVTNSNGADSDGATSHTYVINGTQTDEPEKPELEFPDGTSIYSGTLVIEMMGGVVNPGDETLYAVYITPTGDGTCIFSLPNFHLDLGEGPVNLGDIVVENSTLTVNADGTISYTGTKPGLELAGGEIVADVEMSGTEQVNGQLSMDINVMWTEIPIHVTFNGKKTGTTGVEFTPVDNVNAPVEYFNLQGVRVANPENGIFIKRQGSNVSKIIF